MIHLTDEHLMFRKSLHSFINREIAPFVDEWEENKAFPFRDVYKKLGNHGYLGLTYPAQYGGLELDFWYTVIWIEEIGTIAAGGIPMSLSVQTEISTPGIARYGSDKLKEQFLKPAILGDFIGALAITEPWAGSDVSGIRTIAKLDGATYVINGKKSYITNGSIADFVIVLCKHHENATIEEMSLLVVPTNSPGFQAETPYKKLGNQCCDHAELSFHDVRVPADHLIGMKNMGYHIQMEQFQHERLIESILSYAQAKRILERTKAYAKERKLFGKRLIEHQNIAFSLVTMETELEFLKQMNYHCVELFVNEIECTREIAMVKFKAGKLIRQVVDDCLQLFGGYGYMEEVQVARAFRDTRATAIAGGSVETMQHVLTKFL